MKNLTYLIRKFLLKVKNWDNPNRANFLDVSFDYCLHNNVGNGYFEFGVFKGNTFQYAFNLAQLVNLTQYRFFAFDSFQGFSKPGKSDNLGLINEGDRFCSLEDFKQNISNKGVDLSKVQCIQGWFADTLKGKQSLKNKELIGKTRISIAYFDADLYEPTKLALDFATDFIDDGSIFAFDNWFLFKGHPMRGEQRAFEEWRKKNSQFIVSEFYKFGWHGNSFIISKKL